MEILQMESPNKYYVELITDVLFSQSHDNKLFDRYKQLKMDILLPKSDKPLPLIIFIDGGRFLRLNRTRCIPSLVQLAEKGYVVASIDYRLSNEANATFPAPLHDVKTAVRFLRAHAELYNIDPDRIGVWGKSAGGTLASLLGTTGNMNGFEGDGEWKDYSSKVSAVVNFFGVTDLIKMEEGTIDAATPSALLIGGAVNLNKERAKGVNPVNYITKETPPFLIIHGDADHTVSINQSELLYEALSLNNVDVTFYKVEGASHDLGDFTTRTQIGDIVHDFFDKKLNFNKIV